MFRAVTLVLLLLLVAADEGLAQTPTARVTGRVVDTETVEPISGARVTLALAPGTRPATPAAQAPRPLIATTNPEGVFVVAEVPTGRWSVRVQKTGYFVVGDNPQDPVIDVTGNVTLPDIQLDRGGSIDGRVLDVKGNRVSDVLVVATSQVRQPNGTLRPGGRSATVQTNDLGEFRLAGLPPGEYYVFSQPPIAPALLNNQAPSTTVYIRTYYPGVADMARATLFTVTRGVTTSALDLTLVSVVAYQVSGIAVDAAGRPAPRANVVLLPAAPTRVTPPINATALSDGTFRIVNVPGGTYRIDATMPVVAAGTGTSTSVPSGPSAPQPSFPEVVVNADVTGMRVLVRPR